MKIINYLFILTVFLFVSCENNPTIYTDCEGEVNGLSIEDNCGICDNNPTNNCILDCSNIWGGNTGYDECGVCGGNGKFNCEGECINADENGNYIDDNIDCFGICNGNAILDECDVCNGPDAVYLCGCSGLEPGKCDCEGNVNDCSNTCGGSAVYDCSYDSDDSDTWGNACGGVLIEDECGVCGGNGAENNFDCDGMCIATGNNLDENGYDECGVCGGQNTCFGFDSCSLPINHIYWTNSSVHYNIDFNIAGFQWNIEGTTANSISGGDAASNGFSVQASSTTVIGFSFTGGTIPSGCGILTNLDLDGEPTEFTNIEFTDSPNDPFFSPEVYYYSE